MGNGIEILTESIDRLKDDVKDMQAAPKKAMNSLMGDLKKRGPGWVAAEVTQIYGVKKADVSPGKSKIGTIKVQGNSWKRLRLSYTGRVLTPTHFGMTPKTPKQSYTLKMQVYKGQKTELGKVKKLTKKQRKKLVLNLRKEGQRKSQRSPIMLMPASKGGSTYIPFQRVSPNRKDVEAIKTTSLPQMISNQRVRKGIDQALDKNVRKRLDHYIERYDLGK